MRSAMAAARSDLKKAYSTTPATTSPPIRPISGMSWFGSNGMPGGGGNGVCRITCSPTPLVRGPFQRATSRSPLRDLLDSLLLTEQPFGKIYSLRQFRHLPAQLLDAFDQLRLVLVGSAGCRAALQSLG